MTPVILLICGIFAVLAIIGLIDLTVHAICRTGQSLRKPRVLTAPRDAAIQPPAQGITA